MESTARRPQRLHDGGRVAVIAPCSPVLEPSTLDRSIAALARLGLEAVLAPGVRERRGYLAGDDRQRAEDLLWALGAADVDAVWCLRGGYGAQRTIAALRPGELEGLAGATPRPFIGFSDVTVLHALLSTHLGWVSFYGPVLTDLPEASDYTLAALRAALFTAEPFTIGPPPEDPWVSTLVPGRAEGRLAGGCLTLLAALCGTPLQVSFADRICFFEDVHEPVYEIDRYLSQLLAAGCLDGCRGIAIGDHADTDRSGPTLGLEQVFAELLAPLGVPTCFYLPLGHGPHLATVPIGARAQLDADAGELRVLEPGVA